MEHSSGERQSSTDSFLRTFLLILLLLNTLVNLFVSKPTVFDLLRIKKLERELDSEIKKEIERNRKLKSMYEFMVRHPKEFKEMFIREYLLKIKKGERIYPLPEKMK